MKRAVWTAVARQHAEARPRYTAAREATRTQEEALADAELRRETRTGRRCKPSAALSGYSVQARAGRKRVACPDVVAPKKKKTKPVLVPLSMEAGVGARIEYDWKNKESPENDGWIGGTVKKVMSNNRRTILFDDGETFAVLLSDENCREPR